MIDCFALLNEPRRPWLEPEDLRQKFLALSTTAHPDRMHNAAPEQKREAQERYASLNTAYQKLREPKERLRHLLELELGTKPREVQAIPPALMDLFMEAGELFRQSDRFLAERNRVNSPLLKVRLFEAGQEWSERLRGLQTKLGSWNEQLLRELKAADSDWNQTAAAGTDRLPLLASLEELCRRFSYCTKWRQQIEERLLQLSF